MIYGYIRVSTAGQVESGNSLSAQEASIRLYAESKGLVIDHLWVEEGISGTIEFSSRPEGGRLWDALRAGDAVIVTKLDRAFRSVGDASGTLEWVRKKRIALHIIDMGGDVGSNAIARFIFNILASVAEWEREMISERTRTALAQRKVDGLRTGRVPWGFTIDDGNRLIELDWREQAIDQASTLLAEGHSWQSVCRTLEGAGHPITPRGLRMVIGAKS